MDEKERAALYDQQTTALYAGLGRFVATFELLVDTMRTRLLLLWNGDSIYQQRLIRPVLSELTAYPIVGVFSATMAEAIKLYVKDEADKKLASNILGNISTRLQKMVEIRNEMVHGTWLIGFASEQQTDFSEAKGFKPKNTKNGVEHRDITKTKADFDLLVDDCRMLTALVNRIVGVVQMERPVASNFVWDEKSKRVGLERSMWTFSPLTTDYAG
jgi:hypothetical protein